MWVYDSKLEEYLKFQGDCKQLWRCDFLRSIVTYHILQRLIAVIKRSDGWLLGTEWLVSFWKSPLE